MREIILKGKRIDNGKWIEGYLFGIWERQYILWGTTNGIPNMIEVIPETVSQYTEHLDKNEDKIFDGNIVKFAEWRDGDMCWIGVVAYDYGSMYVIRGHKNEECDCDFELQLSRIPSDRIEVIGNIHDNPELLNQL